jgi:hypothetical protein
MIKYSTIVYKMPETPTPPNDYSEPEKAAYRDGWYAAASKSPRNIRPNYTHDRDREAFNEGWDFRTSLVTFDEVFDV